MARFPGSMTLQPHASKFVQSYSTHKKIGELEIKSPYFCRLKTTRVVGSCSKV
jgi:hypothetical protein